MGIENGFQNPRPIKQPEGNSFEEQQKWAAQQIAGEPKEPEAPEQKYSPEQINHILSDNPKLKEWKESNSKAFEGWLSWWTDGSTPVVDSYTNKADRDDRVWAAFEWGGVEQEDILVLGKKLAESDIVPEEDVRIKMESIGVWDYDQYLKDIEDDRNDPRTLDEISNGVER